MIACPWCGGGGCPATAITGAGLVAVDMVGEQQAAVEEAYAKVQVWHRAMASPHCREFLR